MVQKETATLAIVEFGRANMGKYSPEMFQHTLVRAFKKEGAKFVVLDDNIDGGQRFLAACVAWAIQKGLLRNERNADDGRCILSSFILTPKGHAEIMS